MTAYNAFVEGTKLLTGDSVDQCQNGVVEVGWECELNARSRTPRRCVLLCQGS